MARISAFAALVAALVVGVAVSGAGATTGLSASYALAGIETSIPTNNTSTFAGPALGSSGDAAFWQASVEHQPLSNCPFGGTASCSIYGGTFALSSSTGAQVAGTFVGGSVTPLWQQAGCGKQFYGVTGTLATTSNTAAWFTATLTHYRVFVFGRCITYFATITGSLQLA